MVQSATQQAEQSGFIESLTSFSETHQALQWSGSFATFMDDIVPNAAPEMDPETWTVP